MRYFTHALARLPIWLLFATTFLPTQSLFAQVSIACPDDIVQTNDAGECGAIVTYTPPVGTGSGTNINTVLTMGLPSGDFFPVGVTEVGYTVSNDEGDAATCSFFITVVDNEDPVFDCPPNITVFAGAGTCSAVVTFDPPTATDNCGVIEVLQIGGLPSGSSFPTGENVIDYEAYDSEGNSAFCRFRIFVIDVGAPTITCPADITVNVTTSCSAVVNFTPPVGSDPCSITNTVLTSGLPSGSTFPLGTTVNTYTVTDLAGNSASCSFNINVVDDAPPTINCPTNIALAAAPGECGATATFATPTATDNCPGVSVTQTAGLPSGSSFPAGLTTVTFTATDGSGNTASCSFSVLVTETVPPTISCPADISSMSDPTECGAIVNYTAPVGIDNCPGASTSLTSGLGSGAFFPVGTTTETYTVMDASGNTASCSFDVTVLDGEGPIIDCPGSLISPTDPGLCEAVVSFSAPDFTDNCPGGSISQTSGLVSGSVFPIGITTVEFTAVDAAGNSSMCSFDIEVVDEEAPTINCPANISVTAGGLGCVLIVNYPDPTVTDNCPGAGFTQTAGPASGELLSVGVYTVSFEAEDASGNTSECSFTIIVSETNDPVFDCPSDLEVSTDPGTCEAIVTFELPDATDPCTSVTVTQTGGPVSGSTFPIGSTALEFTAEDEFGNTSLCTYNVVVTDNEAPIFNCPVDLVASNDLGLCEAAVSFVTPTATDNCDGPLVPVQTAGPVSGSTFPVGSTVVTFEATDAQGNLATCSFNIVVEDTELPTIDCPSNISLVIPPGDCDIVLTYADPVSDDNCPGFVTVQTSGPASGDLLEAGTYDITYEVTDANGNQSSCTFQAVISEETPPVLTCPADISVETDPGLCEAVVAFDSPMASDDCSDVTVTQTGGPASGSSFPIGFTPIEFTAEDESGNTATCTFNVTVSDQEAPIIMCPDDITLSAGALTCDAVATFDLPTVSDNCDAGIVPIQISGPASGDAFPLGVTAVSFEATDVAGNIANCSFNVTVIDDIAPEITCPADIAISANDGDCDAVVTYSDPVASDNCGLPDVVLIDGLPSGSVFPVGTTTITFEASDGAGNVASCSFSITVTEAVPPTITCPPDISADNDPGVCGAIIDYDLPSASDGCGDVTITLLEGLPSGDLFPVGATVVTYEATDLSGNTSQCSFTITVLDNEAPALDCPAVVTLPTDQSLCGAVYSFGLPVVTDNCPGEIMVTQTLGPPSGTELPVGTTVFEFTATDLAGNTNACTYNVDVSDGEVPIFATCPEDISLAVEPGTCAVVVNYETPTATDNCEVEITQTEGPASGDELTPGLYSVLFTATDLSGNTSECSFEIQVVDTEEPVLISCPEPISTCDAIVTFEAPIASDNCSDIVVTQTEGLPSGSQFPTGNTTVTFELSDASGNSVTCSFNVEVLQAATRPDAGADQNICDETSALIAGNLPSFGVGFWSQITGGGTIVTPSAAQTDVTDLATGANTFVWSIDPENGCEVLSDTVVVIVEPDASVDAGQDRIVLTGGNVGLQATVNPSGGDIFWSPEETLSCTDCLNPVASPSETTTYFATYTTPLGCTRVDSVIVRVTREFPNTITPNGDGVNDVWNIPGLDDFPNVEVVIYNRWGNEVFQSTGYREPWDGTNNGDDLPTGSYYYILDYNASGIENVNGTVNIIR